MLPSKHRISADKDIKRLVQKGKTFFLPELVIKYKENQLDFSRFAFVISTKVDKRATVRNLLKRRLRAVVGQYIVDTEKSLDVIIIAKKKALDLSYEELTKQLVFVFDKIKLIKMN